MNPNLSLEMLQMMTSSIVAHGELLQLIAALPETAARAQR